MTANLAPGLESRAVLLLPACPDQPNMIADSASIYTYIYVPYTHTMKASVLCVEHEVSRQLKAPLLNNRFGSLICDLGSTMHYQASR